MNWKIALESAALILFVTVLAVSEGLVSSGRKWTAMAIWAPFITAFFLWLFHDMGKGQ